MTSDVIIGFLTEVVRESIRLFTKGIERYERAGPTHLRTKAKNGRKCYGLFLHLLRTVPSTVHL
jgi:hypothetical protein